MGNLSDITFKQFIDSAKVLKAQYNELFTPFFMVKSIRYWKIMIYSLNIPESKKDKIWRFLNDDIEYEELIK